MIIILLEGASGFVEIAFIVAVLTVPELFADCVVTEILLLFTPLIGVKFNQAGIPDKDQSTFDNTSKLSALALLGPNVITLFDNVKLGLVPLS